MLFASENKIGEIFVRVSEVIEKEKLNAGTAAGSRRDKRAE